MQVARACYPLTATDALSANFDAPNAPTMPGVNALPHDIAAAIVVIAVVVIVAGVEATIISVRSKAEASVTEAATVVAMMPPTAGAVLPISRSMLPVRRAAPLPAGGGRSSYVSTGACASTGAWISSSRRGRRHSRRVNIGACTEAAATHGSAARWRAATPYAAATARDRPGATACHRPATAGAACITSGSRDTARRHGGDRGRRK